MNAPLRRTLGALAAGVVALGIGAGTRAVYSTGESDAAVLRFSWRARSVLVEECRRLTEDERGAVPAHMRRDRICDGRIAPYRLRIDVDGERVVDAPARGAGLRGDRPIYVYRELRTSPGAHRVRVRFERVGGRRDEDEADGGADDREEGVERGRGDRSRDAAPALLTFERTLTLQGGDVALVTYDAERRRLVLRREDGEDATADGGAGGGADGASTAGAM